MWLRTLILIVLLWIGPTCNAACGLWTDEEDAQITRDAVAVLKPTADDENLYHAEVDLGKVPAGRKVRVALTLKNESDRQISFVGVSRRCACAQFEAERRFVPERGETIAKVTIKTPRRSASGITATNQIELQGGGRPVIRVEMNYELEGVLAFVEVMGVLMFDTDAKTKTVEIPFITSPPIDPNQVQVHLGDELKSLEKEVILHDRGGVIKLNAPESIIANGPVRGIVQIQYPSIEYQDAFMLAIKDARSHEISPRIIRFKRIGNEWVGSAIVRLAGVSKTPAADKPITAAPSTARNPSALIPAEAENKQSEESPKFRCLLAGRELKISANGLTPDMFRVQLFIPLDEAVSQSGLETDAESNTLRWEIFNGGKTDQLTSPCVFDNPEP
jgi:hypothetical protein